MLGNLNSNMFIVIGVVIGIALLVLLLRASYVKAPPDKAAVVTGPKKEPRIFAGQAGFKIPFFEQVDWVDLSQITIELSSENFIPTNDFIDIQVNAIAQVALDSTNPEALQIAVRNFLNKKEDYIRMVVGESLKGNLRESIGQMGLKELCQDKTKFSEAVKTSASEDMSNLGIRIISLNIQDIEDRDGLIQDLGIDNRAKIQKDASIAKAEADKEVEVARALADNQANEARVKADEEIAKRNNDLAIKKAKLQEEEVKAIAIADIAGEIQSQTERKKLEIETQMAEIAKREKEIELQAKEAEVTEKKLEAEIRKKAEADKYAKQQEAEALLYERQKEAEARLYEIQKDAEAEKAKADAIEYQMRKEAEGIKAKGEAEAEAIRAKGLAEAEALDQKAEAMKKMDKAAIAEMFFKAWPEAVGAAAKPLEKVGNITMYGEGNSAKLINDITNTATQVSSGLSDGLGIDLKSLLAGFLGGKVAQNSCPQYVDNSFSHEQICDAVKDFINDKK